MRPPKANRAFTLVEMLVSIAVLVMLILLILELFNSATATASLSRKHIDSDEEARVVLDRMGADLARMVRRSDVNYIFCKNTAAGSSGSNDAMFFYSEGPGYISTNGTSTSTGSAGAMSLVGFRINSSNTFYPGIPVMERLGENLSWGGPPDTNDATMPGGMVFLTNPIVAASTLAGNWTYTLGQPPYNLGNSLRDTSHFQLLSDMVFRMEFCFLVKSGTYNLPGNATFTGTGTGYLNAPTATPPASSPTIGIPTTSNYFSGSSQPDYQGNVYGFPPDLGGIVVTIAVLDNTTRKILPSGGLAGLGAALSDSLPGANSTAQGESAVQTNPQLTGQLWQSQLQASGFAQSLNIPQIAVQQVRVYERTFYLDAN